MRGEVARDDGLTLVELLVAMSILAVVMAMVTGSTIFLQRSINETDQRFDDLGQARVAMDATSKWVRSAVTVAPFTQPFFDARADRIDLLTNVDVAGGAAPRRVAIDVVNGDQLRERIWQGTFDVNDEWRQVGTPTTRIIARGVVNTTDLFTYLDADGVDMTNGTTSLTTDERDRIRRIGIDVAVQQDQVLDVPPIELSNVVWVANQFYFDPEDP